MEPKLMNLAVGEQIKRSYVSPSVRATLNYLPSPITLQLGLPPKTILSPVLASLMKACDLVSTLQLCSVEPLQPNAPCTVLASTSRRRLCLSESELPDSLETLVDQLVMGLYDSVEVGVLLRRVALVGATASTLQSITTHMLMTYDPDKALFAFMSGITAGYCLGFNRAIFFRHDPDNGVLMGHGAIGPANGDEARRIWERIEAEDTGIESLLARYDRGSFHTSLRGLVHDFRISLSGDPEDEFSQALAADGPVHFQDHSPKNLHLKALGTAREFVLAPVRAHQRLFGIIFTDDYYLPRPMDPIRLRYLKFFIDQTALVWENQELIGLQRELARRDPLTGAFNRREMDLLWTKVASRAAEEGSQVAVLLVDLDHFKAVNDTRGHLEGDRVLRGVVNLVRAVVREEDHIVRYGGDEFLLILPNTGREAALRVAGRIMDAVPKRLNITLSMGCAMYPEDGETVSALFQVADDRLYRAKEEGRQRVV